MSLIGRLLKLLLVVLVVVVVAAGAFVGWVGARGLPQDDGTVSLPGLSADVTVKRDANGIAQIYAGTPADLFAAEGYVHAQDRMWQMDVWRHISSGTLSELFGKSELQTDEFIRTLGWRHRRSATTTPPTRARGDPEGICQRRECLAQPAPRPGPAVRHHRLPWGGGAERLPAGAVDARRHAGLGQGRGRQLGGDYDSEVFDLLLAKKVDAKAVTELSPSYPAGRPVIAPTGAPGVGGAGASGPLADPDQAAAPSSVGIDPQVLALAGDPTSLLGLVQASDQIGQLAGFGPTDPIQRSDGIGSNDWVVSGAHTASGSALLANDPHLGHSTPSPWYMVGFHRICRRPAPSYDVAGVPFPGAPGVVLGHNVNIGVGLHQRNPHVEDLFMEKVDPADLNRYEQQGPERSPSTTARRSSRPLAVIDGYDDVRSTCMDRWSAT